ncbi:MAG: type IVB secretion system protein DotA [Legionellaceae bacterium]|nr:type IVB secretion system protein DotA [Legionellaceae bacterium]
MTRRWKSFFSILLSVFFPLIAVADETGTMSFAPPASDISVGFLGNIFGVVDGVLHGTGSQIMGTMFGVFNAAVLALGGIVIMYIIMVSTMNTAHEGQMLGQKWSSIWVPVRATIGLALLIPKASGYCLMQIFVMWVVLQGVGVADKIWGAALDYMNLGGVIIKANMSPNISMGADGGGVMKGSAIVLSGQACMVGLQTQLETLRDHALEQKDDGAGMCAGTPSDTIQKFCDESVPDFINTVDPLTAYNEQHTQGNVSTQETFSIDMPYFEGDSIYYGLKGVCGTIKWNGMDPGDITKIDDNLSTVSSSDIETIQKSRAAAIEQVYITLSSVARRMVSNDPQINSNDASSDDASVVADDQFGVAYTSSQTVCTTSASTDCTSWGPDPSTSAPVLLDGTELQDAVADYNAIMAPTLKLIEDAKHSDDANDERAFIQNAKERGWIMAGSYFFDLARLNGSASSSTQTDSNTGFDKSTFDVSLMLSAFDGQVCEGNYKVLCDIFTMNNPQPVRQVASLINGTDILDPELKLPDYNNDVENQSGIASSTVYGYTYNAALIDLPDQETSAPKITISASLDFSALDWRLPEPKVNCSMKGWNMLGLKCMMKEMGLVIFQIYIKKYFDMYMTMIQITTEMAWKVFVIYPLTGFTYIFNEGINIIGEDGVNPIVALAKMGTTYIDFAMNVWIVAALGAVVGSLVPSLFAFYMIIAPLFLAWVGVMVGIGFLTAYFIPFMPYMIFTFGSIGWMISVIEAMVAAPIVALGVAHPEGHDALGKSEAGLMILLNVFLRPGMMVIGYIAAIALSFVGIWIMNAGFQNVLDYLESDEMWAAWSATSPIPWARFFGFFFACLIYTMMYLTIVQKAFTLIAVLPDKVLRWIGGAPEGVGQETMQWGDEAKGKIGEAGGKTADAGEAVGKGAAGFIGDKLSGESPDTGEGDAKSQGGDGPKKPPGGGSSGPTGGGSGGPPSGGPPSVPPGAGAAVGVPM